MESHIIDGFRVRRNHNLGYRMTNPGTDLELHGKSDRDSVAIVRIKDCEIIERDGKRFYKPDKAPALPISHGGTYYGYGE